MRTTEHIGPVKRSPINTAISGATLVAAVTAKKIRVLAYTIIVDDAVAVTFTTNASALTGAMSFAANGGVSAPYNPSGHFETVAGEALKVTLGSAIGIRGHLTYQEVD